MFFLPLSQSVELASRFLLGVVDDEAAGFSRFHVERLRQNEVPLGIVAKNELNLAMTAPAHSGESVCYGKRANIGGGLAFELFSFGTYIKSTRI